MNTRILNNKHYDPKTMFNRGLVAQTGYLPVGTQLIQDSWPLIVKKKEKTISESVKGGAPVTRVTGIFQEAEKKNANGRVYPKKVMAEAVDAIMEDIKAGNVWAEYDHPSDAKIHLDRISHIIRGLWMEGNTVFGEADVIEELPYGKQLATLLRYGRVGISSRGVGDIEAREGRGGQEEMVVCEGYRIVTFDCVAEPSVSGAVLQICEGKLVPVAKARPRKVTETATNFLSKQAYEGMIAEEISKYLKST